MTFDRFMASLLFVGVALLACLMPAHSDTWWHLRAGQEMLTSGRVLMTDTFSHTVYGAHWPNYEWLGEVVFALVHRIGGMPLLTGLCAAAVTGGLLFIFGAMAGSGLTPMLLMTGVVAGATITWSVRPQAFSLFFLGWVAWLICRRRWGWLPPVFLIWANMHGAVAWGVVLLTGAFAGFLWHDKRVPRGLVVAAALCGVATLLTPLGLHYWPEILASVQRSKTNEIAEWHAPALPPDHPVFWITVVALPLLAVGRHRRLQTAESRAMVCSALLLLPLAVLTMRNITPFLMLAAPAVNALLALAPERERPRQIERRALNTTLLAVAGGFAVYIVAHAWSTRAPILAWSPIPSQAAAAISTCRGPLYNRYPDGGPIIFFAPSQPVLIDSRQDPYSSELFAAQDLVERTGDYKGFFQRYRINCAALKTGSVLAARLKGDGWATKFESGGWTVLERPTP
jgi:hypothetical protein